MKAIKVYLFTSSIPEGRDLSETMIRRLSHLQIGNLSINIEPKYDADSGDVVKLSSSADVVIFDASVEDAIGTNYKAASMWLLTNDYCLIVSRTRLPVNFIPFHNVGGYPNSPDPFFDELFSLTNEQLVEWTEKQLHNLSPRLPRADKKRRESSENFLGYANIILSSIGNLNRSKERLASHQKKNGRAFISYLSKYSNKHQNGQPANGSYVESLFGAIKKYHSDPTYSVFYYPPGVLSSELMTEYRRWQVVRMLEARVEAAEEFWIFETDDYYDSWWTQAELAMLSYILSDDLSIFAKIFGKRKLPKVIICRSSRSHGLEIKEASPGFIQELNSKTALELRWRLMDNAYYADAEKNRAKRIRQKISPSTIDDFWDSRIVTCQNCVERNTDKSHFDFSNFVLHKQRGQYRVSEKSMDAILESGVWHCPVCSFQYRVIKEAAPQYRWWESGKGLPTGPGRVYIEKRPMYSLHALGKSSQNPVISKQDRIFHSDNSARRGSHNPREKTFISARKSQPIAQRHDEPSSTRFSYWNLRWITACLMLLTSVLDSKGKIIISAPLILLTAFFATFLTHSPPPERSNVQLQEPYLPPERSNAPPQEPYLPPERSNAPPQEPNPSQAVPDSGFQESIQTSVNLLDRDIAFNLVKDLVHAWPTLYVPPHDQEDENILERIVYPSSPYYKHVMDGKNGVKELIRDNSSYSYENLKVELIDYKNNNQNPKITVRISGKSIFSFRSVPQTQKSFEQTVTYLLALEGNTWKIYSSVAENGSTARN